MSRPNLAQKEAVWKVTGFTPFPDQRPPLENCENRVILVTGGERGGKSILVSRGEAVVWAVGFTDLIWIVGPDYEQCRPEFEYMMNDLLQLAAVSSKEVSFPKEGRCMMTTLTGCVIETKTSEEVSKLAGKAPGLVVMVEVGQQSYDTFLKLRGRVAEKRGLLIMSGTLEEGSVWMVDLMHQFAQDNPFDGRSYSVPSWANLAVYPGGREDPEIKHLEAILPESLFLERHAAVPRVASNVVFPEFTNVLHVSDLFEQVQGWPVEITIDPGFAGAYAVEACQVFGSKILVFDEVYEQRPEGGTDGIIEKCRKKPWWKDITAIVIDVAGMRAELTQGKSISSMWQQATKADGLNNGQGIYPHGQYVPIPEGIDRYRAFLKTKQYGARLGFNPRCTGAISEHAKYRYPRKRQSINRTETERPVDAHNHSIKALTYLIVDKFGYWDGEPPVTKVEFAFSKPDPLRAAMATLLPREFRD